MRNLLPSQCSESTEISLETWLVQMANLATHIRHTASNMLDKCPEEILKTSLRILRHDLETLSPNHLKTLLLDCSFLEAYLSRYAIPPPDWLLQLTTATASILGTSPVLTYEWIILTNPLDTKPRLFSGNQEIAAHELLFYQKHAEIERVLYPLCYSLATFIHTPSRSHLKEVEEHLGGLERALVSVRGLLTQLSPRAFSNFRPFFQPVRHRTNQNHKPFPGPSGLYSAAIPCLDIVIGNDSRRLKVDEYIGDLWPMHPQLSWEYVSFWLLNQVSTDTYEWKDLITLEREYPDLKKTNLQITKFLSDFRREHFRLIARFIPEAVKSVVEWTGWASDVRQFLRGRLDRTRSLLASLLSNVGTS